MSDLAEEYRTFRKGGGLVDLSERTLLEFTGPDRVRYLNGQLTANLTTAKAPGVLPACVTTAKGKLCADVFVTVGPDHLLVDADPALADALAARLEKYIVADDVQLANVTGAVPRWHLAGASREALPDSIHGALLPVNRCGVAGFDVALVRNADGTWNQQAAATAALPGPFPVLSPALLELLRIEHGVPRWGHELDENTFPSEAGLDRTHVDFHKGCYIGQEVISRLHSVGHANRELRGFTADAPLTAGARLFAAEDPARELGRLTSAAHSFSLDRSIALGYLRRGAPEIGLLAASAEATDATVPVSLCPLPFVP
jgi:folate-binding protein YgfZ